jgi:receptor protein-tyrosine kinase
MSDGGRNGGRERDGRSVGSVVERAAARLASTRTGRDDPPEPAPQTPTPEFTPQTAPTPLVSIPASARTKVAIDLRQLAKRSIFSPELTANRTTEEFRLIKHAALQRVTAAAKNGVPNANLIMVTSAREGEGKSFAAANLAMSIATEKDRAVILIDADPSRSSVAQNFGLQADRGLLTALEDETLRPADVLLETDVPGLSIIATGPRHPLSAELFASDRMGQFLDQVVRDYPKRIIIFDAPPVLATGEPSALAQHMGQIIFVVEADRTGRAVVAEALNLVNICPNIGLILNKARFQFGAVRFGHYYKYYYKRGRGAA